MKPADFAAAVPARTIKNTLAGAFGAGAGAQLERCEAIATEGIEGAAHAIDLAARLALATSAVALLERCEAIRQRRARFGLFLLSVGAVAADPSAPAKRGLAAVLT